MAKIKQDFEIFQGSDRTIKIAVVNASNQPLNMTGYTPLTWVVTLANEKVTALITKTPTIISIDGTNDGLQFALVPTDTATLKGKYYHEARVTDNSGLTEPVTAGTMTVLESATG